MIVLPADDWLPRVLAEAEVTIRRLNTLLGVSTHVRGRYPGLPVRRLVSELVASVERGEREPAEISLLLLGKLAEDLHRVESAAPALFAHYRRRLRTSTQSTYRGLRFEIGTASALLRHGVPFSWAKHGTTASPDFLVTCPDGTCHIECVVCHVETSSTQDLTYKLSAAITKKAHKPYSSLNLVLFVDTTDLVYARMETTHVWNDLSLRDTVSSLLDGLKLGSVVLIGYMFERSPVQPTRYSRVYLRCDGPAVGHQAKWFLDRYYPRGDKELSDYAVPFTP